MESKEEIRVGDKVYTRYYGVTHEATVIEIKGSKARLRFTNCSGWEIEHWRPLKELRKVKP
jgi:hypothetical protein